MWQYQGQLKCARFTKKMRYRFILEIRPKQFPDVSTMSNLEVMFNVKLISVLHNWKVREEVLWEPRGKYSEPRRENSLRGNGRQKWIWNSFTYCCSFIIQKSEKMRKKMFVRLAKYHRRKKWIAMASHDTITIPFILLFVLHNSEHYLRFNTRNTVPFCFLTLCLH